MDRHMKSNWWLPAVIACVALAADPSLAARRGKSNAPASHGASQNGEGLAHEGTLPGSHPTGPTVTDIKSGVETDGATSVHPDPPAAKSPISPGAKSAGATHGIDPGRPGDGYTNLQRRAARSSVISAMPRKKPQIVAPVALAPHPTSPAGPTADPVRNAAGLPMSAHVNLPKPGAVRAGANEPPNPGLARNSLGLSVNEAHRHEIRVTATTTAPVAGINGTTMGHAGTTGIGGPAKERSAIGGATFRRF
jgi:hypothetical protein